MWFRWLGVQVPSSTPSTHHRQLVEQAEAMITGGSLAPGAMLPSVRVVAEALAVNPMTVSKAYAQLEQSGHVERLRGRGMQVCKRTETDRSRQDALREMADDLAVRARQLGLNQTQVLAVVREAFRASRAVEHVPQVASLPAAVDAMDGSE